MKKGLTIAFLIVGLTVGLSSTVTADEEETSVDVEISGVTQLDVRPSSLAYTGAEDNDALSPGDTRIVSDEGYEHIEVENIGSERIGQIYAQGTMPTERPFGTDGDSVLHNTGNFVTVSLDSVVNGNYRLSGDVAQVENFHHLNRVEYFEDNPPTYIQTIDPNSGNNYVADDATEDEVTGVEVGRFRVGGAEYFFVIYETTNEEYLLMGDSPHTSTQLGTTDFTNSKDEVSEESLDFGSGNANAGGDRAIITEQDFVDFDTSDEDYTGQRLIEGGNENFNALDIAPTDIGATIRDYNIYVDRTSSGIGSNEGSVIRTKFNVQQQSPVDGEWQSDDNTDSGSQVNFLSATTESESLQPGENFPINFGVQVPLGVDQNAIEEGTVTVISETYTAP